MHTFLRQIASAAPLNVFDPNLPERMAVFGSGARGIRCKNRLEAVGVAVVCFLDNNPDRQGSTVDSLPVLAPAQFAAKHPELPVIVCSWAEEVLVKQLQGLGLYRIYTDHLGGAENIAELHAHQDEVERIFSLLRDEPSRQAYAKGIRQRFYGQGYDYYSPYPVYGHPLASARPGDCIIDGGAAAGDTLRHFRNACGGDCALHLFEPTNGSFAGLAAYIAANHIPNAKAVKKALWDKTELLRFQEVSANGHSNHVAADAAGTVTVQATSLDEYVRENALDRVDLVKLDIEGSELAALHGACETLRRFKPRLQICMYHKPRDLWELPLFVKECVPEYSLYIGLHSCRLLDLVLYCHA